MVMLFGSRAKGNNHTESDLDLCVVVEADTSEKRQQLEYEIEYYFYSEEDSPIDLVVYSKQEWLDNINDPASFAAHISRDGVILHER